MLFFVIIKKADFIKNAAFGGVAHLARALAWHARGNRFKSGHLHEKKRRVCSL